MKIPYRRNTFIVYLFVIVLLNLCFNTLGFSETKDTEKLEFSLRWRGIIGGKSTIGCQEIPLPDLKQKSYLFQAELKTVGLADFLFKIKNEYSTLVILDSKEILPVWWKVKQREKNYKYQEKTDFDELLKKEHGLQNPLSALCVLILEEWDIGDSIIIPVLTQKEIFPVKVQAVAEESLKIYGKTFDTILLDVDTKNVKTDITSTKIREFKIWLTNDDKKLPILMKANTSVGSITVLLDNREELLKAN